jgi:hypothetical protein
MHNLYVQLQLQTAIFMQFRCRYEWKLILNVTKNRLFSIFGLHFKLGSFRKFVLFNWVVFIFYKNELINNSKKKFIKSNTIFEPSPINIILLFIFGFHIWWKFDQQIHWW